MLTDIFLDRYVDVPFWTAFEERDRRFLVQAFRIIEEQVYPYYVSEKISGPAKQKWKTVHARLSTELGLKELSQRYYSYQSAWNGKPFTQSGFYEWNTVCERFVCVTYDGSIPADRFMKERISFFEIAFRELYGDVQQSNEELPKRTLDWARRHASKSGRVIHVPNVLSDPRTALLQEVNRKLNEKYKSAVEEFNTRIRQARYPLNYHNGFVQIANDELVTSEIEQPFWDVVSSSTWKNVDFDMKEALDRRDAGQRDPAFYAARALESAIKIISDKKGWTHGGEKGAHNYLDNLGSAKNGAFIASWERRALKEFFSAVRNPFAHAPGSADMPELTPAQTDWTIETCMVWIKTLIQRM